MSSSETYKINSTFRDCCDNCAGLRGLVIRPRKSQAVTTGERDEGERFGPRPFGFGTAYNVQYHLYWTITSLPLHFIENSARPGRTSAQTARTIARKATLCSGPEGKEEGRLGLIRKRWVRFVVAGRASGSAARAKTPSGQWRRWRAARERHGGRGARLTAGDRYMYPVPMG